MLLFRGRTDQSFFDLSQMWPQQVATVSVLGCGALAERNGHDKQKEKSAIRLESISRHRKWRPEHLQISNEPKGLRAG